MVRETVGEFAEVITEYENGDESFKAYGWVTRSLRRWNTGGSEVLELKESHL